MRLAFVESRAEETLAEEPEANEVKTKLDAVRPRIKPSPSPGWAMDCESVGPVKLTCDGEAGGR